MVEHLNVTQKVVSPTPEKTKLFLLFVSLEHVYIGNVANDMFANGMFPNE